MALLMQQQIFSCQGLEQVVLKLCSIFCVYVKQIFVMKCEQVFSSETGCLPKKLFGWQCTDLEITAYRNDRGFSSIKE